MTHMNELPFAIRDTRRPESTADLAGILATATESGESVVPLGGALSAGTGLPVDGFDIGIDTSALSGVLSWEPADLVLSVRAGTTFAEVQAMLAGKGQEIPVDVAHPERATIGGLIATGFAGPRRLRAGSFRDLLIGCEYVRGDGLVARAGGMVVKNVSGFEVPRFLHGSWGSLAVLSSVNLKVTPAPRADGTLIVNAVAAGAATETALKAVAAISSMAACVVTTTAGRVSIAARALGRERAVSETLAEVAGVVGAGEVAEGRDSAGWWQAYVDRFSEAAPGTLIAMSVRPRDVPGVVARLLTDVGDASAFDLGVDPGAGSVRVRLALEDPESVERVIRAAESAGATWVLERCSRRIAASHSPWGPEPDGIALMRSVKREFDPAGILNRGRLVV